MRAQTGRLLLVLLLAVGCGRWEPADYTGGEGGTGGKRADAGSESDAGEVDGGEDCPDDSDGLLAHSLLAISEVAPGDPGWIELVNTSEGTLDLTGWSIAAKGGQDVDLVGQLTPGSRILLEGTLDASDELALRLDGAVQQYVCWGAQGPTTPQNEAVSQGLWLTGLCVPAPTGEATLHLTGTGLSPDTWTHGEATPLGCTP